jgi:hypothetical protein
MATAESNSGPWAPRGAPGAAEGSGAPDRAGGTAGSSVAGAFTSGTRTAADRGDALAQNHGNDGFADTAHGAADVVKQRASAIWDDAKEAARTRLSEQKDEAADGLGDVAGALRDAARRQRGDSAGGPMAQLTGSAAEGLERLSSTLRGKDVGSMVRDVESFARNQPVAFFGLAVAAGFLAARFLKASND